MKKNKGQNNEQTIPGEGFPLRFKMLEILFPSGHRPPLTDLLVFLSFGSVIQKQFDHPAHLFILNQTKNLGDGKSLLIFLISTIIRKKIQRLTFVLCVALQTNIIPLSGSSRSF